VAPIAPDFVGVSIDWCSIRPYTDAGGMPVLAQLLRGLDPARPDIRIGGDGTDSICPGGHSRGPTRLEARAVASLARSVDAKLILGIDLEAHSRALARRQARILRDAIGRAAARSRVQAIEIGNEPDRYPRYGKDVPAAGIGPYFRRFLHDFGTWAGIVRRVFGAPRLPVSGPGLGRYGLPWISGSNRGNFARFAFGAARPALITFHTYPLLGSAKCPSRLCGSLPDLLLQSASGGLAARVARYVGLARSVPVRADEMNSVTQGGRTGVSNTFGAALWAADTLFEMARAGVVGVNLHTFSAARYALFSRIAGGWRVHPEYYGLLLFEAAAPAGARLLRVTPGAIGPVDAPDVKVWATRGPDSDSRIAIINEDAAAHTVVLGGAGVPQRATVTVARLAAPAVRPGSASCPTPLAPTGLCASGGVTFGGRTFGPHAADSLGGDETSTGVLGAPAPSTCSQLISCIPQSPYSPSTAITVEVPAGSAMLLTGRTAPPGRAKR
jgi:hypothetical protein